MRPASWQLSPFFRDFSNLRSSCGWHCVIKIEAGLSASISHRGLGSGRDVRLPVDRANRQSAARNSINPSFLRELAWERQQKLRAGNVICDAHLRDPSPEPCRSLPSKGRCYCDASPHTCINGRVLPGPRIAPAPASMTGPRCARTIGQHRLGRAGYRRCK